MQQLEAIIEIRWIACAPERKPKPARYMGPFNLPVLRTQYLRSSLYVLLLFISSVHLEEITDG